MADEGVGTRREADKIMLDELNKLDNKKLTWNEWFAKKFTKPIIWVKHKLGFGVGDQLAVELHKPIRHKFKRRRVFVYTVDDIWTADLMDFQKLSKHNKNFKYLLNVIDTFSKFAYSIPLKTKSSQEITAAFEKLFLGMKPRKLWTDQGTEFTNNQFKKFLADNNIELYHVYNEGKAVIAERFNRTLGEMIAKHLTSNDTKNYVNVLQKLIDEYNNKYHTSIKMSPVEAQKSENVSTVFRNLYGDKELVSDEKPKFKIGDRVRIYRWKSHFEKGRAENWTREIFVVSKVKKTNPITYELNDLNGEPILGGFYANELQKTKF
jgi:transposase InsO family protein